MAEHSKTSQTFRCGLISKLKMDSVSFSLILLVIPSRWICFFIWLASNRMTKLIASAISLLLHIPAGVLGLTQTLLHLEKKSTFKNISYWDSESQSNWVGIGHMPILNQSTATKKWAHLALLRSCATRVGNAVRYWKILRLSSENWGLMEKRKRKCCWVDTAVCPGMLSFVKLILIK